MFISTTGLEPITIKISWWSVLVLWGAKYAPLMYRPTGQLGLDTVRKVLADFVVFD